MCGPGAARSTLPPDDRRGAVERLVASGRTSLFFDRNIEPVLEVEPNSTLEVETLDCAAGLIRSSTDLIPHIDDLIERLGGLNFVTGPISVRGVEPGDVLRVSIVDVEPAPQTGQGFIALTPGFGTLSGNEDADRPVTTICSVDRDHVTIPLASGTVTLPCAPFVGTIGVAPIRERRMTLSQGVDYVGDIDLPQFRAGSTLLVRANHPGGLLSLGDVHAVQGDGEFGGFAVEIDARVTIAIEVCSREDSSLGRLPVLLDDSGIGVVSASQGTPTVDAVRSGANELAGLLTRAGMNRSDAVQYLSAAARVRLGNMFEPFYSAYVYVDRSTLPVRLPADLDASAA
jgi:amidase